MKNIFLIADTHFGDQKLCNLESSDGKKYRPWNKSSDMDEDLIRKWNEVVGKNDLVYHLGDVSTQKEKLKLLRKCNGEKILIKGNRDNFKLIHYTTYFSDIRSYYQIDKLILTHVPLFPACIKTGKINVHGHLHKQEIKHIKYLNVCVENINYTPISIDDIKVKTGENEFNSLLFKYKTS
jgi:calcineurin-like phosphoesterase family protein